MTSLSSEGSPTLGPASSAVGPASTAPFKKRSRASDASGASAYILHQNEVRAKFRGEHLGLSYRKLLPEIAAKTWQNLDPVEKQRCQDIVDKGKAVYIVKEKAYDMTYGGSNAASPTTTTTLRVPSTSHHHPYLVASLNGGGMTPISSHSRHSSEEEESKEEESEDDQRGSTLNTRTAFPLAIATLLRKKRTTMRKRKRRTR
ncbi:hypothetical protein FS837_001057, partial [Tulasnella sp. UAMH 9824]